MKYRDFKAELDKYFKDDDEIFPHAGFSCVSFYKIFHGQTFGIIVDNNGETTSIEFCQKSDLKGLAKREAEL